MGIKKTLRYVNTFLLKLILFKFLFILNNFDCLLQESPYNVKVVVFTDVDKVCMSDIFSNSAYIFGIIVIIFLLFVLIFIIMLYLQDINTGDINTTSQNCASPAKRLSSEFDQEDSHLGAEVSSEISSKKFKEVKVESVINSTI